MKKDIDLARAWRDEDYYMSLSEEERASLGAHPAGALGVADEALRSITGGCGTNYNCSYTNESAICTPCPPKECY
jgi:mersacidin/lichenicidin family type 2 lantibiotic